MAEKIEYKNISALKYSVDIRFLFYFGKQEKKVKKNILLSASIPNILSKYTEVSYELM